MKKSKLIKTSLFLAGLLAITNYSFADRMTGRGTGPVIYVESQGLYFDSIVLTDLPMKGRFQKLFSGDMGLTTLYGPGDQGHVGGRWWMDLNEDGEMDENDKYFLCPLLGPGREEM